MRNTARGSGELRPGLSESKSSAIPAPELSLFRDGLGGDRAMMRPTNMVIQRAAGHVIVTFENARVQTQIIVSPARLARWARELTEATDTTEAESDKPLREALADAVSGINPPNRLPAILARAREREK
jgi:hypothetical protein